MQKRIGENSCIRSPERLRKQKEKRMKSIINVEVTFDNEEVEMVIHALNVFFEKSNCDPDFLKPYKNMYDYLKDVMKK